MWHVSSRSGVATLRTAIHLLLTYLLTFWHIVKYTGYSGVSQSYSSDTAFRCQYYNNLYVFNLSA